MNCPLAVWTSHLLERPSWLVLLAFVPLFLLLVVRSDRAKKIALRSFGHPSTLGYLGPILTGQRGAIRLFLVAGLATIIAAAAGPRWGKGGESGVLIGRDLVVVLDLSRSMTASDMTDPLHRERWQAARAGVHFLLEKIRESGGHRIGLVVFASRPWTVCPLTSDYEHVRNRLDEFSPASPPLEIVPDLDEEVATGSDIGEAIRQAVLCHDPLFPGFQDVLLLTDGDGPLVEPRLQLGIREASLAQIPIHVVGLGDPDLPTELAIGQGQNAEFFGTKLQESTLKNLARVTRGEYVSARRETPDLGEWFVRVLEERPSREIADDAIPQPRSRSVWFGAIGLLMLVFRWVFEK